MKTPVGAWYLYVGCVGEPRNYTEKYNPVLSETKHEGPILGKPLVVSL